MQFMCLNNGSYLLKSCHNPFGEGFQPTPPYGKIPVEHLKSLRGASLTTLMILTMFMIFKALPIMTQTQCCFKNHASLNYFYSFSLNVL